MEFRKKFCYVDVHSSAQRQWKRVKLDEVDKKLLGPSNNFKCFQSVQRYAKASGEADAFQELMWMPLFFDLDSEDPGDTIEDVKKIHNYLTDILEIDREYIRIWFSGKKGFHIVVEPEVFGIKPEKQLHFKIKKAAMEICELLSLTTFDAKVYSVRRVLRVANSIHQDTKLFKTEVSLAEVAQGIASIVEKAKRPSKLKRRDDPEDDVPTIEEAKEFWDRVTAECEEAKELQNLNPSHRIKGFGELPVCMKHLLALEELPTANSGNRTVISMASYLKDAKHSLEEAIGIMVPWALKLKNIGWSDQPRKLEASVRSTVKYIYHKSQDKGSTPYHFACKYILALKTPEHAIPCQGLQCPAIKGKMQATKETIKLDLADFSKSIYLGEKVKVPTLLSGKAGTPFVVPQRVKFTCEPDPDTGEFCKNCPVAQFDGTATFDFAPQDPEILEIVNTTNARQWEAIRRKFRFPMACKRARGTVENYMNIEEVRLSPAAIDVTEFKKNEHVSRRGFYMGYPIEPNKRYNLTGYPVKDPKTQASTFMFMEKERLETEVETFQLTKEVRDGLKLFQAKEGELEEKWREIHEDLAHNVYRIWNRTETAWCVDLVAHSVRGFRFRSEPFVKGWVELLIVGDSGQGKTSIVRRLVQGHYRVGEYISGGSARRTGLLYSFQENGKGSWMLIWGALPLNDLGLAVIDEFGDLPEEEFSKLTDVRSSGIVKATGVVTAETFARVRLIALTNPKKGRHLAEYEYPVASLKELVPAAEDIRRFDFACAVSSGEVAVETINDPDIKKVDHKFTSGICSDLIRWAWSRTENQVEFTDDCSRLILHEATRMAKEYYAGAIPLVEPADQRLKIARLSAACAARVFSTDDTGEKLIVKPEHVLFVTGLLSSIYNHANFRYRDWSRSQLKTDVSSTDGLERAFKKIQEFTDWKKIFGVLTMPGQLEAREMVDALDGNRTLAQKAMNVLRVFGVVQKKWGKYVKTARGNQMIQWALNEKKVTKEEIEEALMGGRLDVFGHQMPEDHKDRGD